MTSSTEPAEPDSLSIQSGAPVLTWSHSDLSSIRFFRIYRITGGSGGCCNVGDRYDLTSGNVTTWTDPNPPALGTTVRYWVTAVGPGLNESTPSNDVSWTGL